MATNKINPPTEYPYTPEAAVKAEAPIKGIELIDLFDYCNTSTPEWFVDIEKALVSSAFLETGRVFPAKEYKERNTSFLVKKQAVFRTEFVFGPIPEIVTMGSAITRRIVFKRNVYKDLQNFRLERLIVKLHPILQGGWRVNVDRYFDCVEVPRNKPVCSWSFIGDFPISYPYLTMNKRDFIATWKTVPDLSVATLQMGQMMSTIGKVNKATDSFQDLANKFQSTIEPDNLKGIIRDAFKDATSNISLYFETLLFVGAVASGVRYKQGGNPTDLKVAIFASSVLLLMEAPNIGSSITEYFGDSMVDECLGARLQDGEIETTGRVSEICESIHSAFKSILPISFKDWKSLYTGISGFDRFKSSLASLVTFIGNLLNRVSEFVVGKRLVPDSVLLTGVSCDHILAFAAEIDQLALDINANKLEMTNDLFMRICDMKKECESYLINQKTNAAVGVLTRRYKDLSAIVDKLRMLQPGIADTRPEPVGILFRGVPGGGKSTWSQGIAAALAEGETTVYPRNFGTEYWDGYTNQRVITIDDFGQTRDVAGSGRSEFMELIMLINTIPYIMHKAAVEDKGTTFCRAEYIFATTNLPKFNLVSITDSTAVIRRFQFVYNVRPKFGYAVNDHCGPFFSKPDWSKFPKDENGAAILSPDSFEFVPHDLTTGQDLGGAISVGEVMKLAKEQRVRNEAIHKSNLNNVAMIKEAALKFESLSAEVGENDDITASLNMLYGDDEAASEASFRSATSSVEPSIPTLEIIPLNEGNSLLYGKLSSKARASVDKAFDLFESCRSYTLDRGKAFGTLMYRCDKSFILELITDTLSPSNIKKLVTMNFARLGNFGAQFVSDTRSCLASIIGSEDKVFSRAHWMLALGSGAIGVAIGLVTMWESTVGEVQSVNVPVTKSSAYAKLSDMRARNTTVATVQSHDIYDLNGKVVFTSIFQRNLYSVMGGETVAGHALFIVDRYALFQEHWVSKLRRLVRDDPTVRKNIYVLNPVCVTGNRDGIHLTCGEIIDGSIDSEDLANHDHALVLLPPRVRIHKDIRQHFKSTGGLKPKYDYVRRFEYTRRTKNNIPYVSTEMNIGSAKRISNQLLDYEGSNVEFDLYGLRMPNHVGMCGIPYTEMNVKTQTGKIIGLHCAGVGDLSFCSPVPKEILDLLTVDAITDPMENIAGEVQSEDPHDHRFYCVGESKPMGITSKSDIEKSRFYGKLGPVITYPSRLVPFKKEGQIIDPVVKSLSRYNNNQSIVIDPTIVSELVHSEIDWMNFTNTRTTPRRIYTIEEAVLGLEDDCEFKSITRNTSPGYPYVLSRKGKGRREFFGNEPEFDLTTPKFLELREEIESDEERMINEGIKPFSAYIDCLKDETVSKKKFDSGMTRTFSAGDLKSLILYRRFFGDFVNSMTKNRFDNGSTIGINPYSSDWHVLAIGLLSKNIWCNAGDYSGFDTAQSSQLIASILPIIESHYVNSTKEERRCREILWRDLTTSVHISKGKIYKWDHGLPSGTYLTSIINSIINRMYHKLAFRTLTKNGSKSFWDFNKSVCLYTHGDDSVFTVIPQFAEIFNEFTLGPIMKVFGMTYTPEDKGVRGTVQRSLEEISFLKRRWRFEPLAGRWVAPMIIEPLLDQLNWTKKIDGITITIDKANTVSRELAMHPEPIFNEKVRLINDLLAEHYGENLECTNYQVNLEKVLNLVSDDYSPSNMNFSTPIKRSDNDLPTLTHGEDIKNVSELTSEIGDLQMADVNPVSNPRDLIDMDDAAVAFNETPMVLDANAFGDSFTNTAPPDIARFLGKPTVMESGTFKNTDGPTTFSSHPWYDPLKANIIAEKIKGIYTVKADLVLTLNVNATPMQQGRYILAFLSTAGSSSTAKSTEWYRMHRPTLVQILQLPHVEVDLSTQTEAVLRIPWVSMYNSYYYNPVGEWNTNPGSFFLYPYEPLTTGSGGSLDAGYYLWGHYEKVELGVVGSLQSDPAALAVKKTAGNFSGDIIHEEQDKKKTSKVLYASSAISGSLAAIPLLSSLAGPLSFAFGAAGMIADALGFSKPNLVDPPVRSVRNNFPYMAAADGVDAAEPMSLAVGNHVSMDPCFYGTAMDEMSIAFIASRPSFVGSYDISVDDVSGTLIASFDVSPVISTFDVVDGSVMLKSYGPLAFLARMFNLYKGSLVFDLKFIKTKFHSARILVAYQPVDAVLENVLAPSDLGKTDYMFRNIIDLREKTEASIVVPYISPSPWQETRQGRGYTGKLHIYVLDALKAPEVVSTTITMKVEMRGGSDFGVASPRQLKFNPVVPATLQSNPLDDQYKLTCIGDTEVPRVNYKAEEASIGELVPSIRLLTKRGGFMFSRRVSVAPSLGCLILPHVNYYYKITGGVIVGLKPFVTKDFYSAFSSIYALSRGGVRIRFFEVQARASNTNILINMDTVNSGAGDIVYVADDISGDYEKVLQEGGNLGSLLYNSDTPVSGIVVPQYTRQLSKCNVSNFITNNANLSYNRMETSPVQLRYVNLDASLTDYILMHRAVADDGGFGNFVSIPLHYDDSD